MASWLDWNRDSPSEPRSASNSYRLKSFEIVGGAPSRAGRPAKPCLVALLAQEVGQEVVDQDRALPEPTSARTGSVGGTPGRSN
jgi:hypothetical protein